MQSKRQSSPRLAAAPLSAAVGLPLAWLADTERARAAAFAGPDSGYDGGAPAPGAGAVLGEALSPRGRFLAGRLLLRWLADEIWSLGGPAGLEVRQWCPRCGPGAHGAPTLHRGGARVPVALSYSRCGRWFVVAGCAAERGQGPGVGIDLADTTDDAFAGTAGHALDAVVLSGGERELLDRIPPRHQAAQRARWWAAKEALGKALGQGITGGSAPPAVAGVGRHPALDVPGAVLDHHLLPGDAPGGLTAALVLLPEGAAAPVGTTTA